MGVPGNYFLAKFGHVFLLWKPFVFDVPSPTGIDALHSKAMCVFDAPGPLRNAHISVFALSFNFRRLLPLFSSPVFSRAKRPGSVFCCFA
jgi:hypothetical protein